MADGWKASKVNPITVRHQLHYARLSCARSHAALRPTPKLRGFLLPSRYLQRIQTVLTQRSHPGRIPNASSALYWRFARKLPTGRASRTAPAGRASVPGVTSLGSNGPPARVADARLDFPVRLN